MRVSMVLDKYETINQHTEYEDSFLLVHMDSIGIMGGLLASIFLWILCYKLCRSKGARKLFNRCCSRCCEGGGSSGGRHEEVINISTVSKPTVVSISEALNKMEEMHGMKGRKKDQPKPSAPEFVVPKDEVGRYRALQDAVDRAYKEVMDDDP